MNKRLKQICKEADQCAKEHHASNPIKCLKKKLEREIGGDRDLLLAYKISCSANSRIDLVALVLAEIALSFTLLQIILGAETPESVTLQIVSSEMDVLKAIILETESGIWATIFELVFPVLLIVVIVATALYVVYSMREIEKNNKVLLILEQIEKNAERGIKENKHE